MSQPTTNTFNFNNDHKKKIESTKFVFIAAPSGIGKTFSGDYLEAIMGWKHIDGDYPIRNTYLSDHYKDITERLLMNGKYGHIKEKTEEEKSEWYLREGYHGYMTELSRLTLEGATVSDKVVLTHASYSEPQRLFVRQKLMDSGAKPENITMIFLECDRKVHDVGVWKRWNFQADAAGCTVAELFQNAFGIEGILDFESFQDKFQDGSLAHFSSPQDPEKPYTVIDVTARNSTVLDSIDKALGLENTRPTNLTYVEMQHKVATIDRERDQKWGATNQLLKAAEATTNPEEIEVIKKNIPDKYSACCRRSTLSTANDLLDCIRRLSAISGMSNNTQFSGSSNNVKNRRRSSRQSFLLTGMFTIE